MKIINLVEDTGDGVCQSEHGLSFYIETEKHKLLADSGATDLFLHNAERLGVDLTGVDTVVVSHGHYDHAGGLTAFAKVNPRAKIYIKASADGAYYHLLPQGEKYIGIDRAIARLPQVVWVKENLRLDDELFLFSGFEKRRYPAWSNRELMQKDGGVLRPDDFAHEQCLAITEKKRRVLLSGCAHNGILSILDRYKELFSVWPDTVLSGFHMVKKGDYTQDEADCIRQTAQELLGTGALFYTGHCTGPAAFALMKEIMGERLQRLYSGAGCEA